METNPPNKKAPRSALREALDNTIIQESKITSWFESG